MESKARRILITCVSAPIIFVILLIKWILGNHGSTSSYIGLVVFLSIFAAIIGFADYKIKRKWLFILFSAGIIIIPISIGMLYAIYVNQWAGIFLSLLGVGMLIMLGYYTISMLLQTYLDRDNILLDILYQLILLVALALWLIPEL